MVIMNYAFPFSFRAVRLCHPATTSLLLCGLCALKTDAQIQQAWVAHYNNAIPGGQHHASRMLLDGAGNIYVCGASQNTNGGIGYATLKYGVSGNLLWVARFDAPNFPAARPTAIALDSQTNVLVTGN